MRVAGRYGERQCRQDQAILLMQAFTYSFAMDYLEGEDHTIEKPEQYDFGRIIRHIFGLPNS